MKSTIPCHSRGCLGYCALSPRQHTLYQAHYRVPPAKNSIMHLHKTTADSEAFLSITTTVIFDLWIAISMIVCTIAEIFFTSNQVLIIVRGICCNLCHDWYSQSKIADSLNALEVSLKEIFVLWIRFSVQATPMENSKNKYS